MSSNYKNNLFRLLNIECNKFDKNVKGVYKIAFLLLITLFYMFWKTFKCLPIQFLWGLWNMKCFYVENASKWDAIFGIYLRKGNGTVQTANHVCAVYRGSAIAENTVCKWFSMFRNGHFELEDWWRPGLQSLMI